MAITAITAYTPVQTLQTVSIVCLVFAAINLPSIAAWTLLGVRMAQFLNSANRLIWFNRSMAVLLLASLYPVLTG